jgi:hypothetical protein
VSLVAASSCAAGASLADRSSSFAHHGQPLGLVLGDQGVDQFAQTRPGEHFGQAVEGQVDAVIGDGPCGKL